MIQLTKRLQAIADRVPKGAIAVDIGSDHGLLARYLHQSQSVKRMFATEYKIGPYRRLSSALKGTHIDTYQADGLSQLPETADAVIIAGMGGLLIASMIRNQLPKRFLGTLILCPHQDVPEVRLALAQKHFAIRSETMVFEKKFYVVMTATPGTATYSDEELKYGPILMREKGPVFQRWIEVQIHQCQRLLTRAMPQSRKNDLLQRLKELNHLC